MKLSIIMPVYNVENYIAMSIESVLNQDYLDFELLIINDGSTDRSREIAESYTDNRIKIFDKINGGLSDARNFGLKRARGEYIYFIDSDDWVEPELLGECIMEIEKKELDILIFGYYQDYLDENDNIISYKEIFPKVKELKRDEANFIKINLFGILGYAWNKIYKRSLLMDNGIYFDKGISLVEDILFNVKVYDKLTSINFIDKAYYHYACRDNTTLATKYYNNSFELKIMKSFALEEFFVNWNVENKNEILAYSFVEGIKQIFNNLYSNVKIEDEEKKSCVKKIFANKRTQALISVYNANTVQDKILKFLIRRRMKKIFMILFYVLNKIKS